MYIFSYQKQCCQYKNKHSSNQREQNVNILIQGPFWVESISIHDICNQNRGSVPLRPLKLTYFACNTIYICIYDYKYYWLKYIWLRMVLVLIYPSGYLHKGFETWNRTASHC